MSINNTASLKKTKDTCYFLFEKHEHIRHEHQMSHRFYASVAVLLLIVGYINSLKCPGGPYPLSDGNVADFPTQLDPPLWIHFEESAYVQWSGPTISTHFAVDDQPGVLVTLNGNTN